MGARKVRPPWRGSDGPRAERRHVRTPRWGRLEAGLGTGRVDNSSTHTASCIGVAAKMPTEHDSAHYFARPPPCSSIVDSRRRCRFMHERPTERLHADASCSRCVVARCRARPWVTLRPTACPLSSRAPLEQFPSLSFYVCSVPRPILDRNRGLTTAGRGHLTSSAAHACTPTDSWRPDAFQLERID